MNDHFKKLFIIPVCKLKREKEKERERERGHSKPFKDKRYIPLLTLPMPKCSIIIKVNYTGKIMVQKVSNDVRIIA